MRNVASVAELTKSFFAEIDKLENREGLQKLRVKYLGREKGILTAVLRSLAQICSWTPEESQVESSEHQDNANIHCQPFPESVSEEHEIYTDYDGCHRQHVKHDSYLSAHFS